LRKAIARSSEPEVPLPIFDFPKATSGKSGIPGGCFLPGVCEDQHPRACQTKSTMATLGFHEMGWDCCACLCRRLIDRPWPDPDFHPRNVALHDADSGESIAGPAAKFVA